MKKLICFLLAALLSFSFLSCSEKKGPVSGDRHEFFAMDTLFWIKLPEGYRQETYSLFSDEASRLERVFSARSRSSLFDLNESGDCSSVNESDAAEIARVLMTAVGMSNVTHGAFSPVLGALTSLWDFGGDFPKVPDKDGIGAAKAVSTLDNISFSNGSVSLSGGAKLDLGGCVKGYAADRFLEIIKKNGIPAALCSLGGNILAFGGKKDEPFRIGLREPLRSDEEPLSDNGLFGRLLLENGIVSVSGGYERWFSEGGKIYHHILDPDTGYPAETDLLCAVAVTNLGEADAGIKADCFSTALFEMGYEKACLFCRETGASAILVTSEKSVYVTADLADDLTLYGKYTLAGTI